MRKCRRDDLHPRLKLICVMVGLAFSGPLIANPTGPSVVSGTVKFSSAGNSLAVTNSPNAIINWRGFSIGASETTRFVQQSAASSVLNRVVGQDPSAILGTLSSNGRVFLINPNGILFGAGSRVDVAGLVASTLNITDQDFLAGRLNFQSGAVANPILNYGKITTPAGGRVYLIAPDLENHGVITTPQGQTVLAAGKSAQLVEADVPNLRVEIQAGGTALNVGRILADGGSAGIYAGLIRQQGLVRADSVARNETGNIVFRASGQTMLEAGSLTRASGEQGGRIEITGNEVGLVGNARVEATGRQGGGTVLIGGDYQGNNADVPNARATYLGPDAAIDASATQSGDGGNVFVWSSEATRVYGAISARGGAASGNGGFVETSGQYLEVARAPDVSARNGSGGTWLLDPFNMEVVAVGVTNNSGVPSFTPSGNDSQVGANLIDGQLNANTNVVLDTGVPGGQAGNITVSAGITKTNTNNASLSLNAANAVTINAPINLSAGGGNFNVTTASTGGTMMVSNAVTAGGAMNLNLAGALVVQSTPAQFAGLSANSGQTITARSIAVTAQGGFSASIFNNTSGNQNITVNNANVGTGIDILNTGTAFAGIQNSGTGTQTITVNNADRIKIVGQGAGGSAAILASADQNVTLQGTGANAIELGTASAAGRSSISSNSSGGSQTITAGTGAQLGAIRLIGGISDGSSNARIAVDGGSGSQTISTTGNIVLTGGSAPGAVGTLTCNNTGACAEFYNNATGPQVITAAGITITGGATGKNNVGKIQAAVGSNQVITVGAGGITLAGGEGTNNAALISMFGASGPQTISVTGAINVQGGGSSSGSGNYAEISQSGSGLQHVTANALSVQGGNAGAANRANISVFNSAATGGQLLDVGSGGIALTGGSGSGGSNSAGINQNGTGGTQVINVNAGSVALLGGIGSANNTASIFNSGTTQIVNVNNAASVSVVGRVGGASIGSSGNQTLTIQGASSANALTLGGALSASLSNISGKNQVVTAGTTGQSGSITVQGGTANATNTGIFSSSGPQTVSTAGMLSITGGSQPNTASTFGAEASVYNSGTGLQTVSAKGISLQGGSIGSTNAAFIQSNGSQSVTVDSSGILLTGGSGGASATDNAAFIYQSAATGTSQTVTVKGGGSITMLGGSSAKTNVGGFGHGSRAFIGANGDSQKVDFTAGGAIALTGGTNGSRNFADIFLCSAPTPCTPNGTQTITGATSITLTGGASGGIDLEGNNAFISSNTLGLQTITAGSIVATGGSGGAENNASISSSAGQTISASGITLTGGAGGGGLGTGNFAGISSNGSNPGTQSITVGSGGLTMNGGGGTLTDNYASVFQAAAGTGQTITVNGGGAITLRGGSTAQSGIGTASGNGSFAFITTDGASQAISFTAPGGSISIAGGTVGSRNSAGILARNGPQTISGTTPANSPTITLHGGASGGVDLEGNSAIIQATVGPQSITAGATGLTAGASGIVNFAGFFAPNQNVTIHGDLALTGGGASATANQGAGAVISGASTTPTNLTLQVDGNLTMTGGSAVNAGTAIGGAGVIGGQTTNITMNVGGNITLNPGTVSGSRIGSPVANVAGGNISVTAGGNIALNSSSGVGTSIRTLGNVTLHADSAGKSISEGVDSVIQANALTATSSSGTSLIGANLVSSFAATTAGGNVTLNNAGPLVINGVGAAGGGTATIVATGTITLNGAVSATGAGNSIVLASGGNFVNNAGAAALSPGAGRWLVYSANPLFDTLGGLTANFKQYNATYGVTSVLGTGNGLLYSLAPVIAPGLTGSVTKFYDGTAVAALLPANYTATGAIGGDTVTLNNPATGSFDTQNAGVGKTVTASGLAIASATNGAATVYGYQLGSTSASAAIGTVNAAPLSLVLVGPVTRTYDGTTVATLAPFNFNLTGFVGTESAIITQTVGTYASPRSGQGIDVSTTIAIGNYSPVGGTILTNYVLPVGSFTGTGIGRHPRR